MMNLEASHIGVKQMQRLLDAVPFYEKAGYAYTDASWVVDPEVNAITKPAHIQDFRLLVKAANLQEVSLVASAEQSFLQKAKYQFDKFGARLRGKWQTVTPCFRNEDVLDELHHAYFMKLELINWGECRVGYLHETIATAETYFRQFVNVDIIENDLKHEKGFDIVTRKGRIELGSYGIRQHPDYGWWLYGTGVAEPRLTQAINKEGSGDYKTP